jgi:group I intron endonuclease
MSMIAMAFVYVLRCSTNNKVYVGSAKNWKGRTRDHLLALARQQHPNAYLQRAYNKYGADAFSGGIVEECALKCRWYREQWWIDELKACNRKFGFNVMHSVEKLLPSPAMSKILKAYWKRRWADPQYAKQRVKQLRAVSQQPGVRERMQASKITSWQDPKYRAKQVAKHKEFAEENRGKLRQQAIDAWANPEYRAKQLLERKARFSNPEFRKKLSVAAQNRRSRKSSLPDTHNEIVRTVVN